MTTVRLTGTWSRTDTLVADVGFMRRRILVYGEERGVTGKITARRARPAPGVMEGTFDLQIVVPYTFSQLFTHVGRPPSVESRAKQIVKWFLQDLTCSPPTLVFD